MNTVTCNNCGWVHFTVTKEYVQKWNEEWFELFNTKPKEWLSCYGITDSPPSDKMYYHCSSCNGPHTDFRPSQLGDCPSGSTIPPILGE